MDLLQRLRIFVAVAERSSFARAAEALSLARPRVTNAIAALEEEMGVRLFHRTTRRTALTGEGETLYDQALQLLSEAERTMNLFGGSAASPRGRLRVDVPVALARSVIVPKLAEFRAAYPDIEIVLGVSDQPSDLIADGIDCVIRIGDLPAGSMIGRLIGRIELIVCGSPGYLEARGTPRSIAELPDHNAVVYFSGRGRRPVEWHFIENGVERLVQMRPSLLVNDSEAFVACAIAGLGLIQVPRVTVAEHLAQGSLLELLGDVSTVNRPVSVLYPSRPHLTSQVRAFIDWSASLMV